MRIPFSYVVEPYRKYPNLLEVLLNFLKTEQAPGIRRKVRKDAEKSLILDKTSELALFCTISTKSPRISNRNLIWSALYPPLILFSSGQFCLMRPGSLSLSKRASNIAQSKFNLERILTKQQSWRPATCVLVSV